LKKQSHFLKKYRDDGFNPSVCNAKSTASDMRIEPTFPTKRRVTRKRHFDEINENEENDQKRNTSSKGVI